MQEVASAWDYRHLAGKPKPFGSECRVSPLGLSVDGPIDGPIDGPSGRAWSAGLGPFPADMSWAVRVPAGYNDCHEGQLSEHRRGRASYLLAGCRCLTFLFAGDRERFAGSIRLVPAMHTRGCASCRVPVP
jgi:hypothetical protein